MSMPVKINPEFAGLLRPLNTEEKNTLEKDIKSSGCLSPLILWGDILIDGHNRYEICRRLGIKFSTVKISFEDNLAAEIWILKNQAGRRNDSDLDRVRRAMKLEDRLKLQAKKRQATSTGGSKPQLVAKLPQAAKGKTRDKAASSAGVSGRTYEKAKTLILSADGGDEKAANMVAAIEAGTQSISSAYLQIARDMRDGQIKEPPEIPKGKFNVVYADPPWRYEYSKSDSREIENQYPTMELNEICNMKVRSSCAEDAVLLLWATSPKLTEALQVMEHWGFTYRTCAVWDKQVIGMGYYFRQQHELLLIGSRGKSVVPEPKNRLSSIMSFPRGKHSAKPEEVYAIIEKMYPHAKRIEFFARTKRDGWTSWGNQA